MKRTPLYEQHVGAGARMVPFAGYEMPVQYAGVVDEHHAVRNAAGLFDVSHMGEIAVRGGGALELLQSLTPNDVSLLRPGRAQYSAFLGEEGTFVDDLLVYCRSTTDYLLVVNAATAELDLDWLVERSGSGAEVEVEDLSDATALVALQGPSAPDMLGPLTDVDLDKLRYYRFREGRVLGESALVSRTGYTGEDGFELYVDAGASSDLWAGLLEAGGDRGLVPAGLGARDTLRLEAGMLLSGQDIDGDVTPLEAGLDWVVKLGKGDFVGRDALLKSQRQGLAQRLVGFELTERGIARAGCTLRYAALDPAGAEIPLEGSGVHGTVTSGSWSPTLERAIGIARISGPGLAGVEAGHGIVVDVRRRTIAGRIVDLPFYRRSKK